MLVRALLVLAVLAAFVTPTQAQSPPRGISNNSANAWMQQPVIQQGFPQLGGNYVVLSPIDTSYNCVAHTVGISGSWEWPGTSVSAFDAYYSRHGYRRASSVDVSLQPNVQKVVLYAKGVGPSAQATHTSLQTLNGGWTSKLGQGPVIWHSTPYVIAGPSYGQPHAVYVRPR